jgi:putative Mg2+ transporter-C (MgtC) family protein
MLKMLTYDVVILRLVLAAILGGLIGFERQRLNWAAGLRTHMLVSVGSALIIIVSAFGFSDVLSHPNIILDPSRIAAQVISGIGFLGTGTILLMGPRIIKGLTTAASLWAVAGVGLSVGSGLYFAAFVTTLIVLFILAVIKPLEKKYLFKQQFVNILLLINRDIFSLNTILPVLTNRGIALKQIQFQKSEADHKTTLEIVVEEPSQNNLLQAIEDLWKLPGVEKVEILDSPF